MAKYDDLKAAIKQAIKQNGNQEITGNLLQSTLLSMVDSLGENKEFLGFASPSTNPGTPKGEVFYFASGANFYENFPINAENEFVSTSAGLNLIYNNTSTGYWSWKSLVEITQELGDAEDKVISQKVVSSTFSQDIYTNNAVANSIIKRLYIDISGYEGELQEPYEFTISIFNKYNNTTGIFLNHNNKAIANFINIQDNCIVQGYSNGVYIFAEVDFNNLQEGSYIKTAISNAAFLKYNDPRKSITADKIADNAITTDKIAAKNVTTEKLADNSVVSSKIAKEAVTNDKIENKSIVKQGISASGFLVYGFINPKGNIDNSQTNKWVSTPFLKIDTEYDIICHVEQNNQYILSLSYYDKDKNLISGLKEIEDDILRVSSSDIPEGTVFIRASTRETDKNRFVIYAPNYDYELAKKSVTADKLADDIKIKKEINILKTDSEVDILLKMKKAFDEGDYDVYWEHGTYTFKEVYQYMIDTLKWSWTLGLPIGNNCRYYFNGSTLISNDPSDSFSESRNILDCKASSQNFELYDAILINNGGTYCVHDEGNGAVDFYKHIYNNIQMKYVSGDKTTYIGKCIGGGMGLNGIVLVDKCVFANGNQESRTQDVSWHRPIHTDSSVNFEISITNSYFSKKGVSVDSQFTESDNFVLMFVGNSVNKELINVPGNVISYRYNNEIRTSDS